MFLSCLSVFKEVDFHIKSNNLKHRTKEISNKQLIVRRGQSFSLTIKLSRPFNITDGPLFLHASTGLAFLFSLSLWIVLLLPVDFTSWWRHRFFLMTFLCSWLNIKAATDQIIIIERVIIDLVSSFTDITAALLHFYRCWIHLYFNFGWRCDLKHCPSWAELKSASFVFPPFSPPY